MRRKNCLLSIAAGAAAIFCINDGFAAPAHEAFALKTKSFTVNFQVGPDGRLYQVPIGADPKTKLLRDTEFYPQAGDGYVWEPALQVIHADGNTSTALLFDTVTRSNESPDIELTRIQLRDPAYPFGVTLCFRTHHLEDVLRNGPKFGIRNPRPSL